MKQFYEAHHIDEIVSALLRLLPNTRNVIFGIRCNLSTVPPSELAKEVTLPDRATGLTSFPKTRHFLRISQPTREI